MWIFSIKLSSSMNIFYKILKFVIKLCHRNTKKQLNSKLVRYKNCSIESMSCIVNKNKENAIKVVCQ